MLRYVGNYETALTDHQFNKDDLWITITPKDEYMPNITVNLLHEKPEIFITENHMNLGIICDHEIEQHIERLRQTQITIQEIKELLQKHFPSII